MKTGDLVFLIELHETNCGGDYPKNAIGILMSDKPDRDNEHDVHFPTHRWEDSTSYIPVSKLELVPENRIEEAQKKFDSAKEDHKNALLD